LEAIYEVCGGDLRKAVNSLQAASSLEKPVSSEIVYSVVGRANPADIHAMIKTAFDGDFVEARRRLREMITKYGVAGSDIIKQVHTELFRLDIPENWKVKLAGIVGDVDFRLVEGADEEVQLSALLARLAEAGHEAKGG
ncbi:MAG: replication factor C small subunit, partial [Candidatus Bathyarchaeia archaeon]